LLLLLLAIAGGSMLAGLHRVAHATPHLLATRVQRAPRIDGRLDDEVWRTVPASDRFVQKAPLPGGAPSEPTRLRVAYDDDAIYVAFECVQRTAAVTARLTRRDRPIESDRVEIALDTRRSGTSAYEFGVNAAGVLYDALLFNDTEESDEWDEIWDARVARTADGWSAELRIPLRALRFDALPSQSWGLQARRYVSARQETDEWAYIPRTGAGEVSRYGVLDGLTGLRRRGVFELRPFALTRARYRDPSDETLARGWDGTASAGLDLKAHVTQNLTLDLAINPDFGQVEADQVFLNLTNYEIVYPEKRPFFQEGVDVFRTPMNLVYTRRIGLPPAAPAVRDELGERLADTPGPATLYGAAKLVGKIGRRLSLGVLSALAARNTVDAVSPDGTRHARIAAPMTLFDVVRARLQVGRNTEIGVIGTAVNRFEPPGLYPVLPAGDGRPTRARCPDGAEIQPEARCFHDAYTGGLDARWRSPEGTYVVQGQAIASALVGGPPRRLADGTVLRAGDAGVGGRVLVAKEGGEHWVGSVAYEAASRRLDYNDLGYMQRQNQHNVRVELEWRTLRPRKRLLEAHLRFEFFDRETLAGLLLERGFQLNASGRTPSFWTWFVELHYRPSHFDDRELGDGTALERAGRLGAELFVESDRRRRVFFEVFCQAQRVWNGYAVYLEGSLGLRALPQLDFELLPELTFNYGEPRHVGTGAIAGEQLFARLTALAVGATVRATYTFTPRLSLQLYTQIFLAQRAYGDHFAIRVRPGELVRLDALRPTSQRTTENPDLEEGWVNLNLLLRWEYLPGSTLFVVYTHGQAPGSGGLGPLDHARFAPAALGRGPGTDVLLLKLSYWWG
jgi:hypothetical protein